MKIAFDYSAFLLQKYGGVSRYFSKLANKLSVKHDSRIIAPIVINEYLDNSYKNNFHLLKLNKIPRYSSKITHKLNHIISSFYINRWNPDILHKTFFNNHTYKKSSAKKILNVWDLNHEIYSDLYNKSPDWRPKKIALDLADHVICSSNKTMGDLVKYYNFDLKKASIVYQGVDQIKNIKYNKEKYLLYVGSRLKYKNFDNLLKALSINKQILDDFTLICFGDEPINDSEKNLIKNLNLNEKKILFVTGNDYKLHEYYLNATALIYPSKNEGFGFPPLEAMSFGCPVITSNNSAILEATNLLSHSFDPNIPEDIVSKIEKIVYSKSTINFLIEHGLKRVKNLTWDNTASKILKVYNQVLS